MTPRQLGTGGRAAYAVRPRAEPGDELRAQYREISINAARKVFADA